MGDWVQLEGREINLKLTISFLLPAAFVLLAACGEGSQPLPDIEATVEARLNEERAADATTKAKAQDMTKDIARVTAQTAPKVTNAVPVLTVDCTLDAEQLNISCQAIGLCRRVSQGRLDDSKIKKGESNVWKKPTLWNTRRNCCTFER